MADAYTPLRIAIIEDDSILREELGHFLQGHGHTVHELVMGLALDDLLEETAIDIVILDLNLPGQSGLQISERLRAHVPDLGIIVLSARTAQMDRLASYEHGADIYMAKPCSPDELLVVVQSLGRRIKSPASRSVWQLDAMQHILASADGKTRVQLNGIELQILTELVKAPDRTVTAQWLCELLRDAEDSEPITRRALENKISRLRKKFSGQSTTEQTLIRSVRNEGYQLCLRTVLINSDASAEQDD